MNPTDTFQFLLNSRSNKICEQKTLQIVDSVNNLCNQPCREPHYPQQLSHDNLPLLMQRTQGNQPICLPMRILESRTPDEHPSLTVPTLSALIHSLRASLCPPPIENSDLVPVFAPAPQPMSILNVLQGTEIPASARQPDNTPGSVVAPFRHFDSAIAPELHRPAERASPAGFSPIICRETDGRPQASQQELPVRRGRRPATADVLMNEAYVRRLRRRLVAGQRRAARRAERRREAGL